MPIDSLPNTAADCLQVPSAERLLAKPAEAHKPRILLLYGSNRERSYSRLLTLEAEPNAFSHAVQVDYIAQLANKL